VQPGSLVRVFGIRQPVTGTWLAPATVALIALLAGAQIAQGAPRVATQALDLSRHRGRVVIVDFWASWCKPCRQSIPWLNTLKARYGADGLTIIGVNVDAEREDADRFLRDVPIDFEVMFDPDGDVAPDRSWRHTLVFVRRRRARSSPRSRLCWMPQFNEMGNEMGDKWEITCVS
jgi:thiol-disulfide isomerase/thioredoxin